MLIASPIQIIPTHQEVGQRLDQILVQHIPSVTRTHLQTLIKDGYVLCSDANKIRPSYKVKAGQKITVIIPEAKPAYPKAQPMDLDILFEDNHILVVNKSAGLVVHPAPGNLDKTLVNALLAHCGDSLSGINGIRRPGIVHRLDKDTSGLMVVAKTDLAHQHLSKQFIDRSLKRIYQAIVWGVLSPASGCIETRIGRDPCNRKKMAVVSKGGRTAITNYRTLAVFNPWQSLSTALSLVECTLQTGRTHQIRVHLKHKGHSILGDPTYTQKLTKTQAAWPTLVCAFPRQALHAYHLTFKHPLNDKTLSFHCDFSKDLMQVMNKVKNI